MIVILTGVPGCGKSKVLEFVKEKMDVSILNFGDFMLRIAEQSGLVAHRDDIRKKIDIGTSRDIQKRAAEAISGELGKLGDHVIIDTHCSISSPSGYLPGLPLETLQRLKPDAIVVREVDPVSVVERRERDKGSGLRTKRDEEAVSAIQLQQDLNRSFAAAYSAASGATLMVMTDHDVEEIPFENAHRVADFILRVFEFR
jgi:adenylate kinase